MRSRLIPNAQSMIVEKAMWDVHLQAHGTEGVCAYEKAALMKGAAARDDPARRRISPNPHPEHFTIFCFVTG